MIAFVAADQMIATWEAGVLLVYYALYILWMVFNTSLMRRIAKLVGDEPTKVQHRMPGMSSGAFDFKKEPKSNEGAGSGSGVGISIPELGRGSGSGADGVVTDGDTPAAAEGGGEAIIPGTPTMGTDPVAPAPAAAEEKLLAGVGETPADDGSGDADEKGGDEEQGGDAGGEKEEEEEEEETMADCICEWLSQPYIFVFDWTMPDCKYEDPDDEAADEEIAELEKDPSEENKAKIAALEKQKELRAAIEEAEEAENDEKVAELQKELFDMYEPLTRSQELYLVTFFGSLVWITILSYFMVVFMEKIGCAWGISSFIMGITFLAMGTSVPDALGSIAVAKEGEGDMAVSNAIGSNVFDICIGLGIPWFIATIIDSEGRCITATKDSIVASTLILFSVVIVLFVSLVLTKHPKTGKAFTLMPSVGYILFASYFAFVVFQIIWAATGMDKKATRDCHGRVVS